MLKEIPSVLSPSLLKTLMEMGHGDELVLADGNFPRLGYPKKIVRCDGHGIPVLLDAILRFMPLDLYVEHPVILMAVLPNDPYVPDIWDSYRGIIARHEKTEIHDIQIDKYAFYKRAAEAYAVVTTGETALYANIILKKGVVAEV